MAEFNKAAFSAVDSFFGESNGDVEVDRKALSAKTALSTGKRKGVGSVAPTKQTLNQREITKKLLKVGKKRGRGDDDIEDELSDKGKESDDDEDTEQGRTAIAKELPKKVISEIPASSSKSKIGKKERKRLKEAQEANTIEVQSTNPETPLVSENDDKPKEEANLSNTENNPKKQKRRKVRSKQKNVRKDNREVKPQHLLVGRKNYQGRPLTPETRAKLNLPAPKIKEPFRIDSHSTGFSAPDDDDEEESGLAIDTLAEDAGFVVGKAPEQDKKPKKKKKSKYKNL